VLSHFILLDNHTLSAGVSLRATASATHRAASSSDMASTALNIRSIVFTTPMDATAKET